jgi:hypothetical protein
MNIGPKVGAKAVLGLANPPASSHRQTAHTGGSFLKRSELTAPAA